MDTSESSLALGVFCGFSTGPSDRYVQAATVLGAAWPPAATGWSTGRAGPA
ncbi:hypothetical protein ACFQ10_50945 [Streptomyces indonesiensis]